MIKASVLLRQVATVKVSGAEQFVGREHMEEARIIRANSEFNTLFLNRFERDVRNATLVVYRLEKDSLDAPIMAEIGEGSSIKLCHLYGLLKSQADDHYRSVLTNGRAVIAYILGDDEPWIVTSEWNSGFLHGWHLESYSYREPLGKWPAGVHVICYESSNFLAL